MEPDTCSHCGFDGAEWNDQDTERTIGLAHKFIASWTEGVDAERYNERPSPEVWSIGEHVEHLGALGEEQGVSRRAVHDLWHHLIDVSDLRSRLGDPVAGQTGMLDQISVSQGGVPKTAVTSADVGRRGVDGDVQTSRAHHGRPWQAVCLWSADVIDALVAEGHPVFAGACGENLTLSGIDWTLIRAGAVIEVGDVVVRVSSPAMPCAKNSAWFVDGNVSRMDHDLHPGWSRWYGSVERVGHLSEGDVVTVR